MYFQVAPNKGKQFSSPFLLLRHVIADPWAHIDAYIYFAMPQSIKILV
jgi:hypothetical protein